MSNHNENKRYLFKNSSYSFKKITQHVKNLSVENEDIEIIGIRPAVSRTLSQINRNVTLPKAQRFRDRETGRNWRYFEASSSTNNCIRQHGTTYYKPQSANYN